MDDRFCDWSDGSGACRGVQCYYPVGDYEKRFPSSRGVQENLKTAVAGTYTRRKGQWTLGSGAPGFGFDKAACRAQGKAYSRFNGLPLTLNPNEWPRSCVEAYYGAATNPWGNNVWTGVAATNDQIIAIQRNCAGVAQKFSAGKNNIVLIVANTPRKDSLYRWISESIQDRSPNSHFLRAYSISGTGTTLRVLKQKFSGLAYDFVPGVPRMEPQSGPMGGDVQGGVLMALGRVRGTFFWSSYKTECHRCDINAFAQICNAMEIAEMMRCAYNSSVATGVKQYLAGGGRRS